jgi:hypothetical protein
MHPDPDDMKTRRDLDVLLFAVREGDMRLARLIASALSRERAILASPLPAGSTLARALGEPSPLARRTLTAVLTRLGLDREDK